MASVQTEVPVEADEVLVLVYHLVWGTQHDIMTCLYFMLIEKKCLLLTVKGIVIGHRSNII